ncbi:MAG: S-ribosylhomocysteine lyase [Clostridia bacterium]|nr:S-ribosylhomocysteine lyase [Clostridia bacterium]
MEMIQSFSVDHTRIIPGIFLSRIDNLGENYLVTTYDIRLKRPNIEPVIDIAAMHSLEHIIATFLRNDPEWKDEVIYWGPMGCLTGFYLILKGNRDPKDLYNIILNAFKSVEDNIEVPGAAPVNCGYYRMHNLEMAKWYAREFVTYLEKNKNSEKIFEYPKTERIKTDLGKNFFDS